MTEFTGSGETRIIAPVDFHERSQGRPRSRGPSVLRWILRPLLALFIGAVAAAAWFLFTAASVQFVFEPPAERMEVAGPAPRLQFGGKHLLRPGTYTVRAFREGHQPFEALIEVARGQDNFQEFEFEELPGVLTIQCVGTDDRAAPLQGAELHVDGTPAGRTPMTMSNCSAAPTPCASSTPVTRR